MEVGAIIKQVSLDLNDQVDGYEYTRWSQEQLLSYVREAVIDASVMLKHLFYKQVLVKVEQAAVWQKPCDCTEIIRVIGEADETGRIVRMLLPMQDNDAGMFGNELSRCVTTKLSEYAMSRYSLYAPDHAFFRVYPPVPVGVDKWVMLECFVRPIVEDMGFNVPDELVTLVKHWVIYRALMVDSENNATVTEVAMNHFKVHQELFKGLMALRARETADDSVRAVQKRPSE